MVVCVGRMLVRCVLVLAVAGMALGMSSGPPPGTSVVCNDISPAPGSHLAGPQGGNGDYVIATDPALVLDIENLAYNYTAGQSYMSECSS